MNNNNIKDINKINYNENIIHLNKNSSKIINPTNNNTNNNNNNIINNNNSSNGINQINNNTNNNNNNNIINNNNNNSNDDNIDDNSSDLDSSNFVVEYHSLLRIRMENYKIKKIKKNLTKRKYNKLNEIYNNCRLCFRDFKSNQNIYILPCSHIFHVGCLNNEVIFWQECPRRRKQF